MTAKFPLILGSVGLALLLTACGSSKDTDQKAEEETPAAASVEAPAAPAAPENYAALTGNAEAGEKVFALCRSCHSLKAGENRIGPSLHGVVGATAGHVAGFNYSDANKNSGIVWTEEKLFEYLKNPRATVKGTTMSFAGVPDPQRRADLIAYLKASAK